MYFLLIPILLIAGFVALNWPEFVRPQPLSLGFRTVDAPLGLLMLGLLALALLGFLVSAASMETENLLAQRQFSRELAAQRELADKAEASRFTELRQLLTAQVAESRQHEEAQARAFATTVRQGQLELQRQIEQTGNSLAAAIGELEDRVERSNASALNAVV
jgi:hypothetical protein